MEIEVHYFTIIKKYAREDERLSLDTLLRFVANNIYLGTMFYNACCSIKYCHKFIFA